LEIFSFVIFSESILLFVKNETTSDF
ncbi:hypothetical protein DERP_010993, partial [Dermatophagoides pteronyssinus]